MHATEVIETYIYDTVRLLPRRLRNDVATELRSLLNEELRARTQESGCPTDEALALSLVRGFGRPNEVAARYQPAWTIIDPADSRSFARAAIIGAGSLVLLSALRKLRPSLPGTADDFVKVGILAWLGFLVVAFGARNWICRRWPATALWKPRDRDRANRVGTAVLVPIATFFVVLYGAPTWVLDQISGGRFDTSWAASELLIWGRSSLVGCDVICLRPRYFDNPWWEGSGSEAGKRNGTFRDGSNHLAHTRRKVPFPKHYCRSSRTVPRASAIRSALYEKMAIGSISAASSRCSSTLRVTVALFGCLLLN
jgi:hypothetical protein